MCILHDGVTILSIEIRVFKNVLWCFGGPSWDHYQKSEKTCQGCKQLGPKSLGYCGRFSPDKELLQAPYTGNSLPFPWCRRSQKYPKFLELFPRNWACFVSILQLTKMSKRWEWVSEMMRVVPMKLRGKHITYLWG